jgi:hypothetical protein
MPSPMGARTKQRLCIRRTRLGIGEKSSPSLSAASTRSTSSSPLIYLLASICIRAFSNAEKTVALSEKDGLEHFSLLRF